LTSARAFARRVPGARAAMRALRHLAGHDIHAPRIPNLLGDRDIEWAFVAAHVPKGPGRALDFGPGGSSLSLVAAEAGFEVTSVDLEAVYSPYVHSAIRRLQGDVLELPLQGDLDLVINCSTVEHVGLSGRYGVTKGHPSGDLDAMERLRALLKPGAPMLLTIPVGVDSVFAPLCRVYGDERLPRLLRGYEIVVERYWVKDAENRWIAATRDAALAFEASAGSFDPLQSIYALGCFVLRRSEGDNNRA
jgi:SAM-dependent methyltransferase